MRLTFTDKDLSGGNYIPEGEHEVTVTEIKDEPSKAGNAQYVVTLKDKYGREAKEYFPQTEDLRWKVAKFAVASGIDREQLRANGLDFSTLKGRKVTMVKKQSGVKMVEGVERKQYNQEYFAPTGNTTATGTTALTDEIPF